MGSLCQILPTSGSQEFITVIPHSFVTIRQPVTDADVITNGATDVAASVTDLIVPPDTPAVMRADRLSTSPDF